MRLSIHPIARPECRLPILNNPTIFLQDHRCLAAMNICDEGRDSRIFLVNVDTLESEWIPVPDAQCGPYGFVQGADGNLYVGFFYGRIYSFDPRAKTFKLRVDPFHGERLKRLAWGGLASRAGRIYIGFYPTGEFTEYEIASGKCHTVATLPGEPFGVYAHQFAELPDGRILVKLIGSRAEILIYNPATRRIEERRVVPESEKQSRVRSFCLLDDHRVLYTTPDAVKAFNFQTMDWDEDFLESTPESLGSLCRIDWRFLAIGGTTGRVYEIGRDGCLPIETGLHSGNRATGGIHKIGPDCFACMGDNGLFARFSLTKGPLDTVQLDNRTQRGMNINTLRKIPGSSLVVGSHFISSQIFQADLETGAFSSSLNKVVSVPGQIMGYTSLEGVVYLAVYGKALVLAWRPEEPYAFGENPRQICQIGHDQNRPMGIFHDGRLLYVVTRANYGELGGAMAVIDPASGDCEVFRDFVPTQNPVSFFQHGKFLVGTTEVYGDQGSRTAEAENAVLFVWCTEERKTIRTVVPWPAKSLRALSISPSGILIGFGSGKYFLFDVEKGTCSLNDWSGPEPSSGIFLDENRVLLAQADPEGRHRAKLLELPTNTAHDLGETPPLRFFQNLGAEGVLAAADGAEITRARLLQD